MTLVERIFNRGLAYPWAQYNGTLCWLWHGSCCNKGYGAIKVEGVVRRVHRVLWELVTGRKIREGFTLDHLCRRTRCFRPEHLEEVSRPVNTARGNQHRKKRT